MHYNSIQNTCTLCSKINNTFLENVVCNTNIRNTILLFNLFQFILRIQFTKLLDNSQRSTMRSKEQPPLACTHPTTQRVVSPQEDRGLNQQPSAARKERADGTLSCGQNLPPSAGRTNLQWRNWGYWC